ncbi:universal stress protein [Streptomyces sp. NBC_01619]|uniref:Universal stress protein n=1 Tax=Streptomyces pratisoli TaxID=3139917 RepID=A0ACC6QAT3_9ACTN|nr:universal stress protein [Streptomyces sp. NBC_01619]MCX4510666.1 universal stress protein [Streptomyces sp. NBC_01619]
MSRHVTVGLDGSLQSDAAAEWAAREAVLREVPLRLVHADEWPVWTADPEAEAGVQRPGVQRLWADKLLAEAAERLRQRHPSLEISTRRLSGRPSTALATEAADADLLVLGSRGLSCVMGFVLGSVGMETITAAEGPVVLVRAPAFPGADQDTPAGSSRDVVVGVDIHQPCDPLLGFAFDEAARRGGRLRALHGWSLPPVVHDALALEAAERDMAPDIARSLGDTLAPWQRKYPSVAVVELTPVGAPSQLLAQSAADADLVVVGRRSRRSRLGAHIGPVTHAVIHHCAAPVAIVAHH